VVLPALVTVPKSQRREPQRPGPPQSA